MKLKKIIYKKINKNIYNYNKMMIRSLILLTIYLSYASAFLRGFPGLKPYSVANGPYEGQISVAG